MIPMVIPDYVDLIMWTRLRGPAPSVEQPFEKAHPLKSSPFEKAHPLTKPTGNNTC
jgi:hypothetical protein